MTMPHVYTSPVHKCSRIHAYCDCIYILFFYYNNIPKTPWPLGIRRRVHRLLWLCPSHRTEFIVGAPNRRLNNPRYAAGLPIGGIAMPQMITAVFKSCDIELAVVVIVVVIATIMLE